MFARTKDSDQKTIAATGAETLFLKLLIYVIGFVGSIVVSRTLGPEGRGLYYLPTVAATTVVALGKLGIEHVNIYLLGTRGIAAARLSGQNGLVALVMGGIGVVVLLQGPWALPSVFAQTPPLLLLLAAVTIPFSIHQQFSAGLLTLLGKVTWPFRASLSSGVVQLTALIILGLLGRLDPVSVLTVNVVTIALTWAITLVGFDERRALRVQWDVGLLRETMASSLIIHLAMVLWFLHLRVDTFMVQSMVGTTALGYYSVAVMLAETMQLASDSLVVSIRPHQMGNRLRDAAALSLRGARMTVLIGLALAVGWAAAGFWVIRIFYGGEFMPAYPPLIALVPGMIALGVQRCTLGAVLRAGLPWKYAAIYAVSLIFNVVMNLWLIPAMGITGAAIASSVSYTMEALMFLTWAAKLAEAPITDGLIPAMEDVARIRRAAFETIHRLTPTSRS
jgi:O-antigen/teichoic acid export membrane protein